MRVLILLVTSLFMSLAQATPVSHPDFQPTRDGLELKATATAKWMVFVSVYDAGLYASPDAKPSDVLKKDTPITLEIRYKVGVTKAQLTEAANVALKRQNSETVNKKYQDSVTALHKFYQDVKEGDRFRLDIRPDSGLSLYFNNKLQYQNPSLDFAEYYVGLWLGENPLSDDVRDALLDWSN
jgi:hypothetical protein